MKVAKNISDRRPENIRWKSILLADDDEFVRDIIKTVIQMEGHIVIDAVNGEDAVLKYELYRKNIDLLIFDVIMPGENGLEAYEAITKIDPGLKVIFISGYINDYIRRQDIISKGLLLISKPFSPKELLQQVHRLLSTETPYIPV